jgi:hypothetical protein
MYKFITLLILSFFSTSILANISVLNSANSLKNDIYSSCGTDKHYTKQIRRNYLKTIPHDTRYILGENFKLLISHNCQKKLDSLFTHYDYIMDYLYSQVKPSSSDINNGITFMKLYNKSVQLKLKYNEIKNFVPNENELMIPNL